MSDSYFKPYSINDLNQFNYFNDHLNLWVKNEILKKIPDSKFLYNEIRKVVHETSTKDFFNSFKIFFQNSEKSCNIGLQTWDNQSPKAVPTVIRGSDFTETTLSVDLDHNYRIFFANQYSNVSLGYDISYLENPETLESFYPNVNFADKVPFMYLESCTSMLHPFFRSIFNMNGNTIDEINSRCIMDYDNINVACGIEKSNIRCACQPCYSKHSNQSRHIGKLLRKSNAVTNDPWCIYPACASGMAFKNRLLQKRSACSNISVAGVFLNPGEYSNINISNTQVSASSANDNGINLYGDGNCPEGQHFEVDNVTKTVKCVDNDDKNEDKNLKSFQSRFVSLSASKPSGLHWSLWAMIATIVLTGIVWSVHKFSKIDGKYKEYLLKGIIVGVFFSVFFLIYYIVNKTREGYTKMCNDLDGKLCYYDSQCSGDFKCLDNECSCSVGLFDDMGTKCVVYPNITNGEESIMRNFPYLPSSVFGGIYYYSTVINNEIYVFSSESNFKYDGSRWQELNRFDLQMGFHPYEAIPPYKHLPDNQYNEIENTLKLNTNMCCTNKNKVYVLAGSGTIINDIYPNHRVLIYDTVSNKWEYFTATPEGTPNKEDTAIPRATVIKDDLLYTFGESYMIRVDNLDSKIYRTIIMRNQYSFGSYVYSFVHNDIIYVGGMYYNDPQGKSDNIAESTQGYNIFSYDPVNNIFKFVVKLGGNNTLFANSNDTVISGGILTGYIDGMFYVLTEKGLYYYDFVSGNKSVDGIPAIMPDGTSIFNYKNIPEAYSKLQYKFSKGNTTFHKNGFIFIVTGSGEIFRGYMIKDKGGKVTEFKINPCYGVSSYGQPISNSIIQI